MELSLEYEFNCSKRQHTRISQFGRSPIERKSIELFAADDKPDADNCEHFTIRGYVAEVRKRDTKICWPFIMPNHHISDQEANSLPPLTVSKFRRWDCQDCLLKTTTCGAAIASGNIEVKGKSDGICFHGDGTLVFQPCGSQRLSEENFLKRRLDEMDSSDNMSNKYDQSLCCGKRGTESVGRGLIKEGFQTCISSHKNSKQDQTRCIKFPSGNTKGNACHPGGRGAKKKDVGTSHICEVAPLQVLYANPKVNELIREARAEMPEELPKSVSNNVEAYSYVDGQELRKSGKMKETHDGAIEKSVVPLEKLSNGDLRTATAAHICDPDSLLMEKSNHRASDVNVGPSDNSGGSQDHSDQLFSSNVQNKKVRKVRFLNDIIKSEELRMPQEVYTLGAETKKIGNGNDTRIDSLKRKDRELDHRSLISAQKITTKPRKRRKSDDSSENEEEAASLMHWLREVAKKSSTRKEGAKIKHISDVCEDASKITLDASQGNGVDLNFEGYRIRREDKADLDMKHRKFLQAQCMFSQQVGATRKGHMVTVDVPSKKYQPKLTGVEIIKNSPHHSLEIKDSSSKKAILSKKKKECQVENRKSLQMDWLRDSSSKRERENVSDSQRQKRTTKKQKVIPISEKETLDDFPMDIVELLAKNQHERRLMTTAPATEYLHKVSEGVKNRRVIPLDFNRSHGNEKSDAVSKTSYLQIYNTNNTSNAALSACRRNTDSNKQCSTYGKVNHHVDVNQQQLVDSCTGFRALPQFCNYPTHGVNVPMTNSNRNMVEMQASESCHNSYKNAYDEFSVLLNGIAYGNNTQKVNSYFEQVNLDFNHVNMVSHEPYFQKKAAPYKIDNWRLTNSDDAIVLDRKERPESLMPKRTFATPTSFVGSGKECDSTIMSSADLYTNEAIPAMHLLRLMDRAACSGVPIYASNYANHTRYFQKSDLSNSQLHQIHGSEVGIENSEGPKHPSAIAKTDQVRHRGDSCKSLRPLPRFGVLDSLLQKEITAHEKKCKTPFGLKDRCSDELPPIELGGRANEKVSQNTNRVEVLNFQAFASRYEGSSEYLASDGKYLAHHGCSPAWENMAQAGFSYKDGAIQHLDRTRKMELCIINRNPADFAIVDEDCEFMIGSDDQNPRLVPHPEGPDNPMDVGGKKRQKVMKLTALKRLMRS